MAKLSYTPPGQCPADIYLPQQLQDCDLVFVRHDVVKRPLALACLGPFEVSNRSDKYFTIQGGEHTDTVSINRIKPAFLEKTHMSVDSTPEVKPSVHPDTVTFSVKQTRSSRKVTFSKDFKTYISAITIVT